MNDPGPKRLYNALAWPARTSLERQEDANQELTAGVMLGLVLSETQIRRDCEGVPRPKGDSPRSTIKPPQPLNVRLRQVEEIEASSRRGLLGFGRSRQRPRGWWSIRGSPSPAPAISGTRIKILKIAADMILMPRL